LFYEELIVTDERYDFAMAVYCILAEHLPVRNRPGIPHLVCNEFDETLIRCHSDPLV
jgi:hypothetical protein